MSVFYYLEETFQNLRQHKLRGVLTGFGVAWGIFILVLLLGAGEGFYHGTFRKFAGYAKNSVWFCGVGNVLQEMLFYFQHHYFIKFNIA
jgi:hypothetical protein